MTRLQLFRNLHHALVVGDYVGARRWARRLHTVVEDFPFYDYEDVVAFASEDWPGYVDLWLTWLTPGDRVRMGGPAKGKTRRMPHLSNADITARYNALLADGLPKGVAIDKLTHELNMSRSTIQRRLVTN